MHSPLGGKPYLFKDDSGTAPVEIKSKRWTGQTDSPQDQVEIHGEEDRDDNAVEIAIAIEVDRLQKR